LKKDKKRGKREKWFKKGIIMNLVYELNSFRMVSGYRPCGDLDQEATTPTIRADISSGRSLTV